MAIQGDYYTITLQRAHLEWGIHRYTHTRDRIYGEGYIPIPSNVATNLNIFNSNRQGANIIYNCNSADGFLQEVQLKASGSRRAGDEYAKQFQGNNNLRLLGDWFAYMNANVGDIVKVTWTSSSDIIIELI